MNKQQKLIMAGSWGTSRGVLAGLLLAASAQAVLIVDFNDYSTGLPGLCVPAPWHLDLRQGVRQYAVQFQWQPCHWHPTSQQPDDNESVPAI